MILNNIQSFHYRNCSWPGLPATLPSPASPSAVIVSPETLSRHSSSSPSTKNNNIRQNQFVLALPCNSATVPSVCYPNSNYLDATQNPEEWENGGW